MLVECLSLFLFSKTKRSYNNNNKKKIPSIFKPKFWPKQKLKTSVGNFISTQSPRCGQTQMSLSVFLFIRNNLILKWVHSGLGFCHYYCLLFPFAEQCDLWDSCCRNLISRTDNVNIIPGHLASAARVPLLSIGSFWTPLSNSLVNPFGIPAILIILHTWSSWISDVAQEFLQNWSESLFLSWKGEYKVVGKPGS